MKSRGVLLLAFSMLTGAPAGAAELSGEALVLEAVTPYAPGQVWSAAPPRFVLLEDGQVFVGGSTGLLAGRLEKDEVKALESELDALRKATNVGSSVVFGDGEQRFRLRASKGKGLDLVATGDPAKANATLRPLAAFIARLAAFEHPGLKPYAATAYLVSAKEGASAGGCRAWNLPVSPSEITTGARTIPAAALETWIGGVFPTAACVGERRYVVTLRPLLPGEKP
jgi:hypothetical protein